MTEWEPATDAEVAMRNALRTDDQESYFRILAGVDLLLPVSADALAGLAPLGWGTWSTGGRTHVLAFTSPSALQACLADYTGSARRVAYAELAETWPNLEWWLAVNPGLPIEGYLPAWFVAQLSRGDLRLPIRGPGREGSNAPERIQDLHAAATLAATAAAQGYNAQNYAATASGGPIPGDAPASTGSAPAGPGAVRPASDDSGVGGSSAHGPTAERSDAGGLGGGNAGADGPSRGNSAYGDSGYGESAARGPAPAYDGPGGAVSSRLSASTRAGDPPSGPPAAPAPGRPGGVGAGEAAHGPAGSGAGGAGPVGPGGLPLRTPGAVMPSGLPSRVPGTPAGSGGSRGDGIPGGQFNGFGLGGRSPQPGADQPGGGSGRPGAPLGQPGAAYPGQPDAPSDQPGRSAALSGQPGQFGQPAASGQPGERGQVGDRGQPGGFAGDVPAAYRPPTVPPSKSGSSSALDALAARAPSSARDALGARGGSTGQHTPDTEMRPLQRPDSPLPTRTPMAQTPPLPAHIPPPADTDPTPRREEGVAPGREEKPSPGDTRRAGAVSAKLAGQIAENLAEQTQGDQRRTAPGQEPTVHAASAGAISATMAGTAVFGPPASERSVPETGPGGLPRRQVTPPEERPQSMAAAAQALAGNRTPGSTQQQPPASSQTQTQQPPQTPHPQPQPQPEPQRPGLAPPVIPGAGGAGRSGAGTNRTTSPQDQPTADTGTTRPSHPNSDSAADRPGQQGRAGEQDRQSQPNWQDDQDRQDQQARPGQPNWQDEQARQGQPGPQDHPYRQGDQDQPNWQGDQDQRAGQDRQGQDRQDQPSRPDPGPNATDQPASTQQANGTQQADSTQPTGNTRDQLPVEATQVFELPSAAETTRFTLDPSAGPATTPAGRGSEDDFDPANEVERDLHRAVDEASTDAFLSTLLLATVLVPVADSSRPGSAPGESGFAFRTEDVDGEQFLVVFTSRDRLAEHFAEPTRTVGVRFVELIRNWPDPAWSFAVNPTSPIGARYPGPQVIALAAWAVEAGLGGDPLDAPAVVSAPPAAPAADVAAQLTMMQKSVPAEQVDYYLDRGYDRVAGFVHRAGEVEHLRTPGELFAALGLLYDGSPYQGDAKEAFVLRWPAHRPSLYRIPYGGQNEQALRAMDGWVIEGPPFRGNGFAPGEGRDVIAEFKVDSVRLPHGAQLWRMDADGGEQVIAVFDCDGPVWRRVGER